jgi:putative ATPase
MLLNSTPLAERIRPSNLDEVVGQQHLIGEGKPLRVAIEKKFLPSCIFWGPPGIGKTTLAQILANQMEVSFEKLSAISSGVKDVREVLDKAKKQQFLGLRGRMIVFIDEIHRFSKNQQDILLEAVEKGIITLVGATTENPGFEINAALLSRCEVYTLYALSEDDLKKLVQNAIEKDEVLKNKIIEIQDWDTLLQSSGGDGRKLLNNLDIIVQSSDSDTIEITDELVRENIQKKFANFSKTGDAHYDLISAYIKSIRGSDPNAAIYYLARMLDAGEDPVFIARRLLILASEDIGNANPNALLLADACFRAVTVIGFPECRINLSQVTVYLACSAKSNSTYYAINTAMDFVKSSPEFPVPISLRNPANSFMKKQGFGKGYKYSHSYPNHFAEQEFLPEEISGKKFYDPASNASEEKSRQYLRLLWKDKYGY